MHLAFTVDTRADVDTFYLAAFDAGPRHGNHPECIPSTTPTTTGRSSTTRTASTSKPSATTPQADPGHAHWIDRESRQHNRCDGLVRLDGQQGCDRHPELVRIIHGHPGVGCQEPLSEREVAGVDPQREPVDPDPPARSAPRPLPVVGPARTPALALPPSTAAMPASPGGTAGTVTVATCRRNVPQRLVPSAMERPDPHGSTAVLKRRCVVHRHRVLSVISWVGITVHAGPVVDLSWICRR